MTDATRAADLAACEAPAEAMRGLLPERTDTDAFWDGDDGELSRENEDYAETGIEPMYDDYPGKWKHLDGGELPGEGEDCDDLETRMAVAFAAAVEPLPVEGR